MRAIAWLGLGILAALAVLVAIISLQQRYLFGFNVTSSLPGKLYLIDTKRRSGPYARDDIVAFSFDGGRWGFPAGKLWAKRIAGLPGDSIELRGEQVWVNGGKAATISSETMRRGGLSPVRGPLVPPSRLFVVGQSPSSLDSRYGEFGFLSSAGIVGPALLLL